MWKCVQASKVSSTSLNTPTKEATVHKSRSERTLSTTMKSSNISIEDMLDCTRQCSESCSINFMTHTIIRLAVRPASSIVGRIYQVQGTDPQRYALRLLLLHRRGATSFEDLRTVYDPEFSELPQLPDNFWNPEQGEENCIYDTAWKLSKLIQKTTASLLTVQQEKVKLSCTVGLGITVKCLAYSGIASTLLINGSTAHSKFQIPIPLLSDSTCNIECQSVKAERLLQTTVFIWDEASMIPAKALKVENELCRWRTNEFSDWLLRIVNGQEPHDQERQITLPYHMLVQSLNDIVDFLYPPPPPGEPDIMADPEAMAERCYLTPTNDSSHEINQLILDRLQAPT
eukprot:gene10067-18715_t